MIRLAGSPGVGKSAVGWSLAERLAAQGERVAYLDIDQLGMCYPAPDADPARWALKERALKRVAGCYRDAGVARLVVSGVALPDLPPPELPGFGVRSVWLDAAAETRRSRLAPRGWSPERVAEVLEIGSAEAARADTAWERLPTDELTLVQTVDEVLSRWTPLAVGRPGPHEGDEDSTAYLAGPADELVSGDGIPVLWITGPRCVGASTVGWLIAAEAWRAGRRVGFVDAAQLSFAWQVDASPGLANVVALQRMFGAAGAELLVVVAPLAITASAVRAAFAESSAAVVCLVAGETDLATRALARTRGEGPMFAGDDLLGATGPAVDAVIACAVAGRRLALSSEGTPVVDTSGMDAALAAAEVKARVGL